MRSRRWVFLSVLFFFPVHLSPLRPFVYAAAPAEMAIPIKHVGIRGNIRIDTETIRARLLTKEGEHLSQEKIQSDIKALYEMGFFNHVDAETEGLEGGIALFYVVDEKPLLSEVTYKGNAEVTTETLKERVLIPTGALLDERLARSHAKEIEKVYREKGYDAVTVVPTIVPQSEGRAVLAFTITEGEQVSIRKISFEGNTTFSDRVLRKQMKSRPYRWLTSWITDTGFYRKETLDADVENIKIFYLDHGFIDAQVRLSEASTEERIAIEVTEGHPYTLRSIRYTGNTVIQTSALTGAVKAVVGDVASRRQIGQDIAAISDLYGEQGYLLATVVPDLGVSREHRTVDLLFRITEDHPVKVREIHVVGNDQTREKVIRREIRISEQGPANTKLLRRSFQRLNNLNFFETIEITPTPVSPGWVDIDVKVKEKKTGAISVGGGYNSTDGLVGIADLTLDNFMGRGQLMRLRIDTGEARKTYSLTFREPYLFDSNTAGTFSVFDTARSFSALNTSSYRERRVGGNVAFSRSFGEYLSTSVSYGLSTLEILDVQPNTPQQIKDQVGERLTSVLGLSAAWDTRDYIFDPKSGMYHSLSLEHAGTFLGGEVDYYKVASDSSFFATPWWNHTLSLHGRLGYAIGLGDSQLPFGERFFVGGINTVRGFDFGKAGPIDPATGEILGGNKEVIFNVEYLIPFAAEAGLKGVLFYDYGSAFDQSEHVRVSNLRQGAGFGIRWISPVGPFRLEWGRNLKPRPGEQRRTVEFSIGSLF